MTSRLRTWRSLNRTRRVLLAKAFAYCLAVRAALWIVPASVLLRHVKARTDSATTQRSVHTTPALIGWAVQTAARRVPRATCLVEALAAQLLLGEYGYSSTLNVGVTRGEKHALVAHAWVVIGDLIVVGARANMSYVQLPDLHQALR